MHVTNKRDRYEAELAHLKETLAVKEAEKKRSEEELQKTEQEFEQAESLLNRAVNIQKNIKSGIRAAGAYALGRRNMKQLYSRAYRIKDARNKLKPYLYHLYDLGFSQKALSDLEELYKNTTDKNLKKAAAWELALWHADQYSQYGAEAAFHYLPDAVRKVDDPAFLRKAAIIGAECAGGLGRTSAAKELLDTQLEQQHHPDLYLAMANTENALYKRAEWINRALDMYGLTPIVFNGSTYEALSAETRTNISDGPKVSVIMPAYNAAEGIGTGIESILSQTWENIELLVVDDCSPDDTVDVINRYRQQDDRIRLLSTPENSGPYKARNMALETAAGEFVTINDADDWSHPEKIETQVRHLMTHEAVIANTSAHARLTKDLKLHRRGTPGSYIFSNMSSLMFRRKPVVSEAGYWDTVRFAADSEFKRRLAHIFGKEAVVDLNSGPLSFPRQAAGSLTGSSAFGYKGFLMGARKEYAEVHKRHHRNTPNLYYPFDQESRPYPVPEPMWVRREDKSYDRRQFDVVIIDDFRRDAHKLRDTVEEIQQNKVLGYRTGLIQMARYDFSMQKDIDESIREVIDGEDVHMLVHGEHIDTNVLIIKHPAVFEVQQDYIPDIHTGLVRGVIDEMPQNLRNCTRNILEYAAKPVKWYPVNDAIRKQVNENHVTLAHENWHDYSSHLKDWMI